MLYVREALRALNQHRGLVLAATIAAAAALGIAGVFLLLAYNARLTLDRVGDRRELVVYLHDEVDAAGREALSRRLQDLYGAVTYVSKEEAWRRFTDQVGDPALLEAVGENPLPATLHIKLRPELLSYETMKRAADQVAQFPEVEDVRYGGDWVRRLDQVTAGLHRLALAVGLVVAGCMVLILYTTLHLSVLARREQVEIMSQLGASDRFIAMPFIIEGVLQAGAAALLALALLLGARQILSAQLVGLAFLPWTWMVAFLAAAMTLGCLAAWRALGSALRALNP